MSTRSDRTKHSTKETVATAAPSMPGRSVMNTPGASAGTLISTLPSTLIAMTRKSVAEPAASTNGLAPFNTNPPASRVAETIIPPRAPALSCQAGVTISRPLAMPSASRWRSSESGAAATRALDKTEADATRLRDQRAAQGLAQDCLLAHAEPRATERVRQQQAGPASLRHGDPNGAVEIACALAFVAEYPGPAVLEWQIAPHCRAASRACRPDRRASRAASHLPCRLFLF